MNTKSFTLKVATLAITAATAFLNAQTNELTGNVPMDFVVNGKAAAAGSYRVIEQRPGVVFVKSAEGKNIAIAMLPVQTQSKSQSSKLEFERKNGAYQFTGFCAAGRGCWTSLPAKTGAEKMEVALSMAR